MNQKDVRIPASHVRLLLDFYEKLLERKSAEAQKLYAEIKEIQQLVTDIKSTEADVPPPPQQPMLLDLNGGSPANEYNKTWTIQEKARFVLKLIGKPATTREIFEKLKEFDVTYHDTEAGKRMISNLSAVLGMKFVRTKIGSEYGWALKEWGFTDDRDRLPKKLEVTE